MATQILVSIGSGNGWLPDSTKPLSESMLADHQCGIVAFTKQNFARSAHELNLKYFMETTLSKLLPHLQGANELVIP